MQATPRIKGRPTIWAFVIRVLVGLNGHGVLAIATEDGFFGGKAFGWPAFGWVICQGFVTIKAGVEFLAASKLDGNDV